jgi:hypothetical protein
VAGERYCGQCGHEVSPDDRFCRHCGAPLESAPFAESRDEVAPPPQPVHQPPPAMPEPGGPDPKRRRQLILAAAIAAAALLAAVVLAIVVSTGDDDGSKSDSAASATSTESTETESIASTTEAAPPPDPHACETKGIVPIDPSTPTGKCTTEGNRFTVVSQNGELKTKSMVATFGGIRTTDSISDPDAFDTATAKGTFVIISLSLTNRLSSPADIGSDQTSLVLANGKQYSEDFDAENGIDQQSLLWKSTEGGLQPDGTLSGDVVFDLPPKALRTLQKRGGALVLSELGDDVNSADRFGVIRLNPLGGP